MKPSLLSLCMHKSNIHYLVYELIVFWYKTHIDLCVRLVLRGFCFLLYIIGIYITLFYITQFKL